MNFKQSFLLTSNYFNIKSKKNILVLQKRHKNCQNTLKLEYKKHGQPLDVVELLQEEIPKPKDNEVLVRMLAAPVNPVDINIIEGVYPSKPIIPATPGYEGVGRVIKLGSKIQCLKNGDRVVPIMETLGTWRTHANFPEKLLLKVPEGIDDVQAATISINPCTAYRMIRDFICLRPGDVIIQNGANSSVGQNVIQIAKNWELKTVNVVRNRSNISYLKKYLVKLGADVVLTEEEIKTTNIFQDKCFSKPKLALNCIGGPSASLITKYLEDGCPMVTYGGMSRKPVTVSTPSLIFKDVHVKGFWITDWNKKYLRSPEWNQMFDDLFSMMKRNKLNVPDHNSITIDEYKIALEKTVSPKGQEKKFIIKF